MLTCRVLVGDVDLRLSTARIEHVLGVSDFSLEADLRAPSHACCQQRRAIRQRDGSSPGFAALPPPL
jgi:hypothetical protein